MHASGIGKALLAHMEAGRRNRLLAQERLEQFTKRTITDVDALLENLLAIRERGYSVDDEERNMGMRCIAAPVFDFNGEAVAGISVSGPASRVSAEETKRLARAVISAAQELTLAIGGEPAAP
jgi:IclR family acetate operon transcriptional repressor